MIKNNIIPIILIGIIIAGFFTFVSPTYNEMINAQKQIASYDEALNNSKSLGNERDKLTKLYNSIDPKDLEKLRVLLPDNVDNIRLILEIEGVARPYGMTLKDVKYDAISDTKSTTPVSTTSATAMAAVAKQSDYGTWNLSFSTQGSYTDFISFLKDLESNLRIIDVDSIEFSSNSTVNTTTVSGMNPNSADIYKYNVKFKTYWLKN